MRDCVRQWPGGPSEGWPSWAFQSRRAARDFTLGRAGRSQSDGDGTLSALGAALRGSIFLYYGEELGLPQAHVPYERLQDPEAIASWPQTLGHDGARTPMPWRADVTNAGFSDAEACAGRSRTRCARSRCARTRSAFDVAHSAARTRVRGLYPALKTGDMRLHDAADPLLVFERGDGREALLCVFNRSDGPRNRRLPEGLRIAERFNLPDNANDVLAPLAGYWR